MLKGSLNIFSTGGDFRASEEVPVAEGVDTWQRCSLHFQSSWCRVSQCWLVLVRNAFLYGKTQFTAARCTAEPPQAPPAPAVGWLSTSLTAELHPSLVCPQHRLWLAPAPQRWEVEACIWFSTPPQEANKVEHRKVVLSWVNITRKNCCSVLSCMELLEKSCDTKKAVFSVAAQSSECSSN